MSLYCVQKLLYLLNRDPELRARFDTDRDAALAGFDLLDEELAAITKPDVGLLYVLGVNGQLLMHYAAQVGLEWDEYIRAMRDGVAEHGPVRAGLYAMTEE